MKKLALITLAAAALFASASGASAQYYYSSPSYVVRVGPQYRDDDDWRYRRNWQYRRSAEERWEHRSWDRHYARQECARRNYTVQDGVCKPYRGY